MRAVIQDRYGAPEEALHVVDIERPVPKDSDVLVRVHASSVTRGEAMGVRFQEYRFARLGTGLRRPRRPIDRTYGLDQVVDATSYVESGQKTGSVVIEVGAESAT